MRFHNSGSYTRSPLIRKIQIILLLLIVIGVALLLTQKQWLPSFVDFLLAREGHSSVIIEDGDTYTPPAQVPPGWKKATTDTLTFAFPGDWGTTYIVPFDWPPKIQLIEEAFSCSEGGLTTDRPGKTELHTVSGRQYCVTRTDEGAAGSTYSQYAYAFPIQGKTGILTFTSRAPQCGNYDSPEKDRCEAEKASLKLDEIVDQIVSTIRL